MNKSIFAKDLLSEVDSGRYWISLEHM